MNPTPTKATLRVKLWSIARRAAGAVERFCSERAARACGCDDCRLVYDQGARAEAVQRMVKRIFDSVRQQPAERRPS